MPENILVVEYEPRYTDRVKQALTGQPFVPSFAKDGDEALRALDGEAPRLIVLSSVVPKVSTPDLIRAIRSRKPLADTPILLTVSGYQGKSPKQDAIRMGASDMLPKPYSEGEFLGKIQQMLGVHVDTGTIKMWAPELDPEFTARPTSLPSRSDGQLTSNEIFGELLEDANRATSSGARRSMAKPQDDLDKMLADTLAGVMPQKKTQSGIPKPAIPAQAAPPAPVAAPKPRTSELDRRLSDTLSGLEPRSRAKTVSGSIPIPVPAAPPQAPVQPPVQPPIQAPVQPTTAPKYTTARLPVVEPLDKMPVSQPVFPPAAAPAPASAHEEEEPADGIRFGQYVLLEKIATGGMAEVWKARMRGVEGFQKIVAIKKILPHLSDNQDFIEMFIDEAKLAAQLNHNNIIHIYDLGKIQSSYYIAMEYIDGHDLKTILKRGEERDTPMTVETACFVAGKIAAALDYAHRKHDFEGKEMGLVHRDVSPQNVLISQEGDIKLCDFGIAKAASKASHTQAGALKGKLQYMSPEQAWGRTIDKRSDVFALATVLFEMLTGRKLFSGDNELSILEQVREARVARPSQFNDEVTPEIDAIVIKALQKDPANRYQTAGEMERDINAVLYTFRPTPTSADLAIYMHRLQTSAPVVRNETSQTYAEPEPVSADPFQLRPLAPPPMPAVTPIAAAAPMAAPAPAPALATPTFGVDSSAPKKSNTVPIVIAAVVVLGLIGGGIVMMKKSPAAATPATATRSVASTTPAATTAGPAASTTTAVPVTGSAATSTAAVLDASKVDEEVKKRLAAEKAKLDAQAAKTQTASPAPNTATTAPVQQTRNTPPPVTPAPQPVAPAPVQPQPVAETRPVPAPVQPAAEPRPAPAQAARAQEGDLVQAGTDGLTPPRMTHQAAPSYPQVAKLQRVEGTVLMSVLVNESGQVADVKVVKGDPRLNDAAVQSVRRSSFSAGTKDGAHVKSWLAVGVTFKL